MKIKILLISAMIIAYCASVAQTDVISAKQFMDMTKSNKNMVIIDADKASSYKTSHVKDAVSIPHKTL